MLEDSPTNAISLTPATVPGFRLNSTWASFARSHAGLAGLDQGGQVGSRPPGDVGADGLQRLRVAGYHGPSHSIGVERVSHSRSGAPSRCRSESGPWKCMGSWQSSQRNGASGWSARPQQTHAERW
jgi:hypothetical protein